MRLKKNSFYVRMQSRDSQPELIYVKTDGYTFEWNGITYGLWSRKRGQWIMTDLPTGSSIITVKNKAMLQYDLTDELQKKLEEIYKKVWYKRETKRLSVYIKEGIIYENIR